MASGRGSTLEARAGHVVYKPSIRQGIHKGRGGKGEREGAGAGTGPRPPPHGHQRIHQPMREKIRRTPPSMGVAPPMGSGEGGWTRGPPNAMPSEPKVGPRPTAPTWGVEGHGGPAVTFPTSQRRRPRLATWLPPPPRGKGDVGAKCLSGGHKYSGGKEKGKAGALSLRPLPPPIFSPNWRAHGWPWEHRHPFFGGEEAQTPSCCASPSCPPAAKAGVFGQGPLLDERFLRCAGAGLASRHAL